MKKTMMKPPPRKGGVKKVKIPSLFRRGSARQKSVILHAENGRIRSISSEFTHYSCIFCVSRAGG